MSTDTLTERDPWRVLRAVLEVTPPGRTFSAASWHAEAVLAELHTNQIKAALKIAVTLEWLEPIGQELDGEWSPNVVQAKHEEAVGRWILAYRRTHLHVPLGAGHEREQVPGQCALIEIGAP